MFWIILLFVVALAGLAYGWIVVHWNSERFTVSVELEKITPVIRGAKDAAHDIMHGAKGIPERRDQHSRSGHPS